ncbi:MAG TPA: hypothetical protein VFQ44_09220 [Streptosporangiaceae bacterium]|nr:hypothetical protein [Streptosporangiaceae bacterium]
MAGHGVADDAARGDVDDCGLASHESPAFRYQRCQQDGIFDRFTMHVSALWNEGRDVWHATSQAR